MALLLKLCVLCVYVFQKKRVIIYIFLCVTMRLYVFQKRPYVFQKRPSYYLCVTKRNFPTFADVRSLFYYVLLRFIALY